MARPRWSLRARAATGPSTLREPAVELGAEGGVEGGLGAREGAVHEAARVDAVEQRDEGREHAALGQASHAKKPVTRSSDQRSRRRRAR